MIHLVLDLKCFALVHLVDNIIFPLSCPIKNILVSITISPDIGHYNVKN